MAGNFDGATRPVNWGELVDLLAKMQLSPEVSAAKETGNLDALAHEIGQLSPYNKFTYPAPGRPGPDIPTPVQPVNPFVDDPQYLPCRLGLCVCKPVCGKCGVGRMWDRQLWPGRHDWCCSRCGSSGVITAWQKVSEMTEEQRSKTLENCQRALAEAEGRRVEWSWREDEELEEMMESYEFILPAIERIIRQDEEQGRIKKRLRSLERRVAKLQHKRNRRGNLDV